MYLCKLHVQLKRRKNIKKNTNYIRKLPVITEESSEYWENKFTEALGQKEEIQSQYNEFVSEIQTFIKLLPVEVKQKAMVAQELNHLLEQRRMLYKRKRTKEVRSKITKISKEINRKIKNVKTKFRHATFEKFITKSGALRKAYRELRDKSEWASSMKNKRGRSLTRRPDIIKEATRFYEELYSFDCESIQQNVTGTTIRSSKNLCEPQGFLRSEIEYAIMTQKSDKTPGNDNITNEVLKSLCIPMLKPLQLLFDKILNRGSTPEQWANSTIILIHKKGDRDNIGNYRPISLMTNIYKIFSKIILNRIYKTLDENQPREQAGFRKNYSTTDHLQVTTQIIEKANEYGKTIYMCFIDYQKAFDSLHHDAIWEALTHQGIQQKYIDLIRDIYSKCWAKVRLETEGVAFCVKKGVRQGDPLSPKLFSAVLESIFRSLDWENKGIKIDGEYLSHLRFADDIVIFSENKLDLQVMVSDLARLSKDVGLSLNASKTKILTNGETLDILIDGQRIEYVEEYIYLGQLVSFKNCTEKETQRRIALSWKKYWGLKEIMKSKELNLHLKKKVFDSCILPCLTYGCQTWSLRKEDEERIAICQRKMERSILGIKTTDRISNQSIRESTKLVDVRRRIRSLKWNWAGHLCRLEDNRWTKRVTEWIPRDGKRKQGRQRKRWRDIFTLKCGTNWMQKARDRKVWNDLGEAYASEATTAN